MLRYLLWRLLGLLAVLIGFALVAWFLDGGLGGLLRGEKSGVPSPAPSSIPALLGRIARPPSGLPAALGLPAGLLLGGAAGLLALLLLARLHARRRRRYVRLRVEPYRTDRASAEAVVRMYEALHKRLLQRWWRRLLLGQPSVALEIHHDGASAWFASTCPEGLEQMVEAALQAAYPNCRVHRAERRVGLAPTVLRLKKRAEFIKRVKALDHFEHEREPPVNRLLTVMAACGGQVFVQLTLTPTPAAFERLAKHLYKRHEARLSRERREHLFVRDRSMVEDAELRGGLDVQHSPLFFTDLRIVGRGRRVCERIASELRAEGAENRLVERGTTVRHGVLALYGRRVQRGEGNPLPPFQRGVLAATELAALWHLPSIDYTTVPLARNGLPLAPAPPGIFRPGDGHGALRDALGAVSIHVAMRKQNTAVPGTVEQGKTSYLVATVAEDLRRARCTVIVLDPKGDAAEAAVSLVPADRACTLLDFSRPTCGFNPLAVDAPADVIADYVVAALKNLFSDADIRASSDRYLRNAIIAVLAHDRASSLWDAARLLSVGEEGYAYRSAVGARVRKLPEFKEISQFFTAELTAQLADARSTTTAKLDAPVNKLARLLNSPSIKRVLLNDSLRLDFDRLIAEEGVLVVRGALGAMGAGNTSVLMQLLLGMLDASLARQQDLVPAHRRVAVALKIDEAPLVLNRGFAETMALKRSAGLETVACWQTDAQWVDREVRDQLDALFAHRVYFATASARDARSAVALTMAEFSDTVRPGVGELSALGHPDVRLHLPKHHAIVSWSTPAGRQPPFIAQTVPLHLDGERVALHAARQLERGGSDRVDLRQPHWDQHVRGTRADRTEPLPRGGSISSDPPLGPAAPGARADGARTGRGAPSVPRAPVAPPAATASPAPAPPIPAEAAASYRELVELDGARSVRWARAIEPARALQAEPLDLEILALLARMRHLLSSQIHRRFNPTRAPTTTQRRLKRLSDAGLVRRFQFHRPHGGGVPMCYLVTAEGLGLLRASELLDADAGAEDAGRPRDPLRLDGARRLREARRDIHVAGWALALERTLEGYRARLRGAPESVLSPPAHAGASAAAGLGPADLRLPGGRAPHDFLRTDAGGAKVDVERFETVRPDATVELRPDGRGRRSAPAEEPSLSAAHAELTEEISTIDVMVEFDDRIPVGRAAGKLERYDHFLSGWSVHTRRYGRRSEAVALVVFLCRDRARARECARAADGQLRACRAYAGEYPFDWDYPGRERILFVSERDVHEGLLCAYGVPRLPPDVRVTAAHGDPRAAEAEAQLRELMRARPATPSAA